MNLSIPGSFQSFHTRICHSCNLWSDLSGIDSSFGGFDVATTDFTALFSGDVTFLREQKFQSVEELIEASERYLVAHLGKPIASKSVCNLWNRSDFDECLAHVSWIVSLTLDVQQNVSRLQINQCFIFCLSTAR